MSSHRPSELDSVASTPRADRMPPQDDASPLAQRVRFMCSFGGNILPRPHDNQLRYVGGETRMVVVSRHSTFYALLSKLSKLAGAAGVAVKYQLPNEDLDALISVTTDEDVENMMEEYERLAAANGGSVSSNKTARLRLFLFPISGSDSSRASSISSLLEGSTRRDWFFDALNSGGAAAGLERGRSEASSMVSEVPDYLFGLDNSDEPRDPRLKTRPLFHDDVSASDPGSPAPRASSPLCSTSCSELPPVRIKPENPAPVLENKGIPPESFEGSGFTGNPVWHYGQNAHLSGPQMQPVPVYYVSGQVSPGNVPVQPVQIRAQYVPQYPGSAGLVPVGFHRAAPGMRVMAAPPIEAYEMGGARVVGEGENQQLFYYGRNGGMVRVYPALGMPGGEELQRTGSDPGVGRV